MKSTSQFHEEQQNHVDHWVVPPPRMHVANECLGWDPRA